MPYTLIIGDRAFSSWSLRGWLLFEKFGLSCHLKHVSFAKDGPGWTEIEPFAPANTVPTMVTDDGAVVSDSLAIAEELASRHPEAKHWPTDPKTRALARTLAAEMHSGFGALREDCPMNLRCAYSSHAPSEALKKNIERLQVIWDHALAVSGGPWLCGDYSAADAFFAPVAARIAGYGIPVSEQAQAYVARHLNDPAFRRWRAMGLIKGPDLPQYARDFDTVAWPGPKPLAARPVAAGPAVNDACPYSGEPVTHFLEMEGKVYGFCNAFCRDKTYPDPEAWPSFMAMRAGVQNR